MASVATDPAKPAIRETLRRELLKLIVKNEAVRRDQLKASQK